MMKLHFLRASFFVWIILPVAAYLVYQIFGLPHFIWSYDWRDNGTYDPYKPRIYTRCSFYGPYGEFTTYPKNGKCEWFRFYKTGGET
jgi:hypothetical protein